MPGSILNHTCSSASFIAVTKAISFSALVLTFVFWLTHCLKIINIQAEIPEELTAQASAREVGLMSLLNLANASVFAVNTDGLITEWNLPLKTITELKKGMKCSAKT